MTTSHSWHACATWGDRDDEDQESRLASHLRAADDVKELKLGPRPDDLDRRAHQDGRRRPRRLRPASPLPRDRRTPTH